MLYIFAVALLVLWLFGLVTSYTISGFVYVLLAVAMVIALLRFISGRRSV